MKIEGYVQLKVFDKYGKPLKREWQEFPNMITGPQFLIDVLTGNAQILYNGVGSGTTAPAIGDEDCDIPISYTQTSEITRKKITERHNGSTSDSYIGLFSTYYATGEFNGIWNESILTTQISGANVICHALLDDLFEKTTTKRAQNDWILVMT